MAHFEVGKKVICIKDHSQKFVKRGQVFPLNGIRKEKCCGLIVLDVGIKSQTKHTQCPCGIIEPASEFFWFGSSLFAPYDDSLSELTDADILHSEPVEVKTH